MQNKKFKLEIDRREFLKRLGAGALFTTAAMSGCKSGNSFGNATYGEVPTDKMTYRTHPKSGDKVSLIGYGCMRWPTRKRADGKGNEIIQETVNELVDYAIEHGVNFF
ncbi:MAG: aldo/keto reductase, partial [Alistipes sp.]|nr:aldo/keto reductase [Alistipes sp.]